MLLMEAGDSLTCMLVVTISRIVVTIGRIVVVR